MTGTLVIVLPLLAMVVCALGFYALGKWLRSRGHGERLDAIDAVITRAQRGYLTILGPLAAGVTRLGRSLNQMPLLGSKRQRQLWDNLNGQAPPPPTRSDRNKL